MKTIHLSTLAVVALCACASPDPEEGTSYSFESVPWSAGDTWFKGNTHAHTTESDGDSPPEYVARWYKDHGYDFLVLSDHNVFTDPATLADIVDSSFLLVPGEEVTSSFDGEPVHLNGLNLPGVVEARTAESLVATIQAKVDAIRTSGKSMYGIATDDAHHFQGEFAPGRANAGRRWVAIRTPG